MIGGCTKKGWEEDGALADRLRDHQSELELTTPEAWVGGILLLAPWFIGFGTVAWWAWKLLRMIG